MVQPSSSLGQEVRWTRRLIHSTRDKDADKYTPVESTFFDKLVSVDISPNFAPANKSTIVTTPAASRNSLGIIQIDDDIQAAHP